LQATIDDNTISVRFKHGIHTIYLFVDSLGTMSSVTDELLSLLRDRFPNGLTTSTSPRKTTAVPADTDTDTATRIAYGALSMPNDPSRGWKGLKIGEKGIFTPAKAGLKNNSIIAFAFADEEAAEDGDATFEVEWPREEDIYDQGS
jgi:hypothetical protein